ncbi:GFA family protein [Reyranella sp.]|uniref:GFA family protein n=1 Tax=Reyranella sp. TaxID=1929291 RepID=UPI0037834ADF
MTSNSTTFEGGCTCRQVRYRMTAKPLFVHCCHCRWCQRETGAAFALNAMIEADRVELVSGEPVMTASDDTASRCGAMAAPATPWPSCASAQKMPPDIHIFTLMAAPATPRASCAAVAEYYDTKKTWPAESLARRECCPSARRSRGLRH